MPLHPDEVVELSRLLDEALALAPAQREPWFADLARSKPESAKRLRTMLQHEESSDTGLLPKLSRAGYDEAVAPAGERVGPYELVREIGRGGMGTVWLAERADGAFKRGVALKLPRMTWSAGLAKRMAREREIGALLEHPNIARLYDAGIEEKGYPYIAMEYIDGQPIDVYCREHALDLRAKLTLFVQVAQAVAYAHGRLVLHRDLKPSNVLVDANGQAHLLDFGIAKLLDDTTTSDLTQEQGRVLTLSYAAPEHIAGRPIGVTADVYALGVMLYELLSGTLPYATNRRTSGALEDAILAGDAPAPSSQVDERRLSRQLRGDLDAIVGKAIKRDPNERYQTAEALAADIQRYLDGHAIEARPDSAWYRLRKAVIRHKVPVTAVSAVLVVALIGGTAALMQGLRAAEEAERARVATAFVAELFRVDASQPLYMDGAASRPTQAMLLDRGAKLIEARFEKQPALKADLYGAVSRVYVDLGQHTLANEFATRQLKTLRDQQASESQIARSLMLLAEASLSARRIDDAEKYAEQAVGLLPRNDIALAGTLALLARAQLLNGKVDQAARTVESGYEVLERTSSKDSSARAWLTYAKGGLVTRQNKFEDALPLYKSAVEEALRAEGPNSMAAIEMQLNLAESLINRQRGKEGRIVGGAALEALERMGSVHLVRAARAKAYLQQREFEMGFATYPETIQVLEHSAAFLARQSFAIPAEVIAHVDFIKAKVYCRYGEYARAAPLIESSFPILTASPHSLGEQFEYVSYKGICEMGLGQHEAAQASLMERMEVRRRMGAAHAPFAAFDWYLAGINLSMQGRHKEALDFLSSAPAFDEEQGDKLAQYSIMVPYALVEAHLNAGNVRAALHAFEDVIKRERDRPADRSWYYWDAVSGELKCAAGEHQLGLNSLGTAERTLSAYVGPNSPELARLRSLAGLCAFAVGQSALAAEYAAKAKRAFTEQPRVSPHFKEPLKRLEQQLGVKSI